MCHVGSVSGGFQTLSSCYSQLETPCRQPFEEGKDGTMLITKRLFVLSVMLVMLLVSKGTVWARCAEEYCRSCHGDNLENSHHNTYWVLEEDDCGHCHTLIPDPPDVEIIRDCLDSRCHGALDPCFDSDDDGTPDCQEPRWAMGIITPSVGGSIQTPDGSVTITVSPGALAEATTIFVTETGTLYEIATNLGDGTALFSVDIHPAGLLFNTPITLVFSWADENPYDGTIDGTNIKERNVIITKDNVAITERCGHEPVDGQGAECHMDANTFTFQVDSLSVFAIVSLYEIGGSGSVGGTASMASKMELLAPWIVLSILILFSAGLVILRSSRKQN